MAQSKRDLRSRGAQVRQLGARESANLDEAARKVIL